jgi:acetolactate synthase I/II/III large subunit
VRVADVLVDGLARAGTRQIFTAGERVGPFLEAAQRVSLGMAEARGGGSATIMAAVTGTLSAAPGAVLVGDFTGMRPALDHAVVDQAPLGDIVKASLQVTPASAGHWIAHASRLAMTAPRGPVHLHVPVGIADMATVPVATDCRPSPPHAPSPLDLDGVAECLARAARPVVVAGVECRAPGVAPWLRAFAESLPAPVLVTPAAKGALPDPHPLLLGQLVPDGDAPSVLARADLIVALGLDPAEPAAPEPGGVPWLRLGCRQGATGGSRLDGDVALILEELAPRLRDRPRADWDVALLDRLKRASPTSAVAGTARPSDNPAGRVIALARRLTPAGTIATSESGLADAALGAWACVTPGELFLPAVPVIRPFALPAAAAAQLARPDAHVLAFVTARDLAEVELEMVGQLGLPIVAVVVSAGTDAEGARNGAERPGTAVAADERGFQTALDRALSRRRPAVIDASGLGAAHP